MDYPTSQPNANLHNGRFTNGILNENIPPSADTAHWANQVTDELIALIADAGLIPNDHVNTQVRDAINKKLNAVRSIAEEALAKAALAAGTVGDKLPINGTAVAAYRLATPRKINDVLFDGTADIEIADRVARSSADTALSTANTKLDKTANAASSTKLVNARTINGVAFDGTKNIDVADSTARQIANDALTMAENNLGATGTASAAHRLATPRKINGVDFDGTKDITVPAIDQTARDLANQANANAEGRLGKGDIAFAANKLATPRRINGVAFDGTKDITVTSVDQVARDAAAAANANAENRLYKNGIAQSALSLSLAPKINGVPFNGTTDIVLPSRDGDWLSDLEVSQGKIAIRIGERLVFQAMIGAPQSGLGATQVLTWPVPFARIMVAPIVSTHRVTTSETYYQTYSYDTTSVSVVATHSGGIRGSIRPVVWGFGFVYG